MGNQSTELDLTQCDREPIHKLGRVQSFGCLIVCDPRWKITHVSENIAAFFGCKPEEVLGKDLSIIFDQQTMHDLRGAITKSLFLGVPRRLLSSLKSPFGEPLRLAIHAAEDKRLIECELHVEESSSTLVQDMFRNSRRSQTLSEFFESILDFMHIYSRFERVMVYKFLPDGSGEVIAERHEADQESWQGLRYPASDIPKQARVLYKKNLIRLIAHTSGETFGITGLSPAEDVNLSMCQIRAVSPVHIQYLKNIDVEASMSLSLVVGDELWGLISCHHRKPTVLSPQKRVELELFSELCSLELSRRLADAKQRSLQKSSKAYEAILTTVKAGLSLGDSLETSFPQLRQMIAANGYASIIGGEYRSGGSCPEEHVTQNIIQQVREQDGNEVSWSESIDMNLLASSEWLGGYLALPLSRDKDNVLLLYRDSETTEVRWAGNPEKTVEQADDGSERLMPRKSFEEWLKTHHDRCHPWSAEDLDNARSIQRGLVEVLLQSTLEKEAILAEAQSRQKLLISELNHRVRNILSLVTAIISQTDHDIEDFVPTLLSRINSLAESHSLLTSANWDSVSFRELIGIEVSAYVSDAGSNAVELTGADVLISPAAVTPLILVLHEMMTNSAKYGALSAASAEGKLRINWFTENEALKIEWRETGGPQVSPPTRRGFGTTLIESAIPHELGGSMDYRMPETGVEADISIPASYFKTAEVNTALENKEPVERVKPLKALVVEDSMLIALDIESKLKELGVNGVSIQGTIAASRQAIEAEVPDFALLDINLGEENSLEFAEYLQSMKIPFLFVSGYGYSERLERFGDDVKCLTKPVSLNALKDWMDKHLS